MTEKKQSLDDLLAEQVSTDALTKALRNAQATNAKLRAKGEELREALAQAAYEAILAQGKLKPVPKPVKKRSRGGVETALLHCTDWQAGKRTTDYNSEVLTDRLELLKLKVYKLTDIQRADHDVDRLHVVFGGDMIEGLFNYPAQLAQIDADLLTQWADTAQKCADLVRWGLSNFQEVKVTAEWGNHGRIGSKRAEVVRSDNFDRMVYTLARNQLKDETRLEWVDCPDDIQMLEEGNYKALVIHGDEPGRNGFASPMTLVRWANQQRSGAFKDLAWSDGSPSWLFRDVYIGHYHNHAEWSMANGEGAVYQTGSTESDNRYARDLMAASATPSQRLHFIDTDRGRVTAQYKVLLDN